jgi:alpha-glucosidase
LDLNLTKAILQLGRQMWKNLVFTADDWGCWVKAGNLPTGDYDAHFLTAVAM